MHIIHSLAMEFVPASHEDHLDPGVLKKILFHRDDLVAGRIQMINWARLLPGKIFNAHSHDDMNEVFIIMSGHARVTVNGEQELVEGGDAFVVPKKCQHMMEHIGVEPVDYIVLGIVQYNSYA